LQDRLAGAAVAVSQVVAHSRDLGPGDGRLSAEQVRGQGLYGFADFQQPDPNGG
jgi:hypothetical protein